MVGKWNLEADINKKSMEEAIIEIFGCTAPGKSGKININSSRKQIKTEFYLAGNAMETMLIEVFGCSSPDSNVTKIEVGSTIKDIKKRLYSNRYADNQPMILLPVNA